MALKTCRECGHKVSSEAKVCPNCGVKEPYQSPVRGLIFIAIVIIAIYKGCSDDGSSASDNQKFSFDCKLSDDNVIWRESGQSTDRWNGVGNVEYNVVYAVKNSTLTITELHAGLDDVTYKFSMKDFQ